MEYWIFLPRRHGGHGESTEKEDGGMECWKIGMVEDWKIADFRFRRQKKRLTIGEPLFDILN